MIVSVTYINSVFHIPVSVIFYSNNSTILPSSKKSYEILRIAKLKMNNNIVPLIHDISILWIFRQIQ